MQIKKKIMSFLIVRQGSDIEKGYKREKHRRDAVLFLIYDSMIYLPTTFSLPFIIVQWPGNEQMNW